MATPSAATALALPHAQNLSTLLTPCRSVRGAWPPTSESCSPCMLFHVAPCDDSSVGTTTPSPSTFSAIMTATVEPSNASVPVWAIPCAPCISPMKNDHAMATRGKHGFMQPKACLNLHASSLSPLQRHIEALSLILIGVVLCVKNL